MRPRPSALPVALRFALAAVLVVASLPLAPLVPAFPAAVALADAGVTARVSVSSAGAQGNGASDLPSISTDSRYVAFRSAASNLVAGDTNGVADVFVHDRQTGETTRVSLSSSGEQANGASGGAWLSGDGRYVAFSSAATNLVPNDTNARHDVFVHDRQTGTTTRVSVNSAGQEGNLDSFGPAMSSDGRHVVFTTFAQNFAPGDADGMADVYVHDRTTGTTTLVSVDSQGIKGGLGGIAPTISDDGRYVAFASDSLLVTGDTNATMDIFVRDLVAGITTRVSVSSAGAQANNESRRPSLSADGRFAAFQSHATNLVDGDTNGWIDVFVHDRTTAATTRVSVSSTGQEANSNSLTNVAGDGPIRILSTDGRFVTFHSTATNLVGDGLLGGQLVHDRQTGATTRVSVSSGGAVGFGENGVISGDGRFVAFESGSTNLVEGDTNGVSDVFVHDRQPGDFGAGQPQAFGLCAVCAFSPDPVNLATGVFTTQAEDLAMPGRVLSLGFTRTYNSADQTTGPLGPAWTHSYNWRLTDNGATVEVRRGDGRRDTFTRNADGSYATPPDTFDVLVKNADGSFTLTLTNQVAYDFSSGGALSRIREPAGNQITLAYTAGNLTTITDTVGRQVALSYDAANRLTQLQLQYPSLRKVTYAYDPSGRLASVVDKIGNAPGQDPNRHRWQYAYDGTTQHLATITDPDGRVRVTNTYDAQGRVSQQRDGLSNLTTFAYSAGQTVLTDPRGTPTTYTFDSRMRVLSQSTLVGGVSRSLTYTYDAQGNRTSVTDRNGSRTDFTYDARGNVLSKTDPSPDGVAPRPLTQFAYDAKNNLTQITDAAGFTTTMTYDPATNVLLSVARQIDATTSATTKYEYADAANPGLPTRIIAPRGNTGASPDPTFATTLAYDAQANLASRTDPDGARTTFGYDVDGRLLSFVDPDGNAAGANPAEHTWTIGYDENDRETSRADPSGNTLAFAYDGAGNRTSLTDRRGNVTTYAYDANTRLASVQQKPDPVGNPTLVYTTSVTRDANGNATRITQANGVSTDYAYDALNRLVSVSTHPDAQTTLTTSYALDGNGQPTSRTTADGVTVSYAYDALSRLTSVSATGLSITYAYDVLGRRTQMTDGTGTTTYAYDGIGRLTQVAAPSGTLTYAYDRDGNRTALGYSATESVSYAYSPGGRLTTVNDWASRVSSYTYQVSGLVSSLSYPNGMRASYTYDRAQRLTEIVNAIGTRTITRHTYTLDAEGNRTALDELVEGLTPPPINWQASAKVNDDTGTAQQDAVDVAYASGGAALAIWYDFRPASHADIFFSRRDPTTGAWSANQKVNDDATNRTQRDPALAVDGADNAYAVWQDDRDGNRSVDTNIYFSKRSAATGTWGANLRVNDDTKGAAASQTDPRVAVMSGGAAAAVWVDFRSNQWNIFSSTLSSGATAWSANRRVTDNTSSRKFTPDIAIGVKGTLSAVWEDDRNGNSDIYFSQAPPCPVDPLRPPAPCDAPQWQANVKISDDPGTAAQYSPQIGVDGSANLIAVWLDDRGGATHVRMSRLLAGSTTWEASRVVSDAAAFPTSLSLSVRSDGKAFVAWEDARGLSYDIWGAEYDPATVSWGTSFRIDDDPGATAQRRPAVAANAGEMVVAWRDDRAGNPDIRAQRATFHSGVDRFTFTYDGFNRLLSVTGNLSSGGSADESFAYDAATNLTSRTGPAGNFSYDAANRLLSDGTRAFVWSASDRLVSRAADSFGYDALGRLTSATVATTQSSYAYNGDSLLASKVVGAATTALVWDPVAPPARLVQLGTDRVVYGLAPLYVARADNSAIALAIDLLGSTRAEVSESGSVIKSFRYAAYGVQSAGATLPTVLGYVGEFSDLTGLIYLRARWYDPNSGRFVTRDPFLGQPENPASLNLYAYASGRPTRFVDPLGLDARPRALNSAGKREYKYVVNGVTVINNAGGFLGWLAERIAGPGGTVTFTSEYIVSTSEVPRRSPLLAHELGHVAQARENSSLGFLLTYGIQQAVTWLQHRERAHEFHPMERDANRRAKLPEDWDGGPAPTGWTYPWPE